MDHYAAAAAAAAAAATQGPTVDQASSINLAMSTNPISIVNHPQLEHLDEVMDHQQNMLNLSNTQNHHLNHHLQQQQQQQSSARYMNQHDKRLMYQLNQYYLGKAMQRSKTISKTIQEVVKIVHDVLRELEIQEPRFISTFTEVNGHYEGQFRIAMQHARDFIGSYIKPKRSTHHFKN